MCDEKPYTSGVQAMGNQVGASARPGVEVKLYQRKHRLEHELAQVNEAIKLVENDESIRKMNFVMEQAQKS